MRNLTLKSLFPTEKLVLFHKKKQETVENSNYTKHVVLNTIKKQEKAAENIQQEKLRFYFLLHWQIRLNIVKLLLKQPIRNLAVIRLTN